MSPGLCQGAVWACWCSPAVLQRLTLLPWPCLPTCTELPGQPEGKLRPFWGLCWAGTGPRGPPDPTRMLELFRVLHGHLIVQLFPSGLLATLLFAQLVSQPQATVSVNRVPLIPFDTCPGYWAIFTEWTLSQANKDESFHEGSQRGLRVTVLCGWGLGDLFCLFSGYHRAGERDWE